MDLNKKGLKLIPVCELEIKYDPNKTSGYDLTVEDFYTFSSYDGIFVQDTMAIFHPITEESQQAIKDKMTRQNGFQDMHDVNYSLSKEMCVGLFILTKNVFPKNSPLLISDEQLHNITDPYIAVKYRGEITTSGKALYNSCFPADYPFVKETVNKSIVNSTIPKILERYGPEVAAETFSKLERLGFKFATIISPTITLDDLDIPDEILQLKDKLVNASTEEADILLKKMMDILQKYLSNTGLADLVHSGSTKGWSQPFQILVAKGIVADPEGNVLEPIKGSFADGLDNKEYFKSSMGARKGIADRVLNTAETGYLARQLAFILNSVEVDRNIQDCKTPYGLSIRLTEKIIKKIEGRYIINNNGNTELFDKSKYKEGDMIKLRSPIFCQSRKICHTCYGKLIEKIRTPYVGIVAGQLLGESASQSMMKTFHLGGSIQIITRDILSDIIQNDPLITLNKSKLTSYIKQDKNILFTNKECVLSISFDDYEKGDFEIIEDRQIILFNRGLISKIEFDDLVFNLILDYPVEIQLGNYNITKMNAIMEYSKSENILEVPLEAGILTEQVRYVKRLLGGKEIFKDVNHLFLKLFNVYGAISPVDLVHMEVLLSQCLRDKKQNELPARLGKKWDPVMINMKQIVFSTSFLNGLAFENINKSINTGLISDELPDKSILEKILTGELVEERTR